MEKLSWLRTVDMDMDKMDLLCIIDEMHSVIDALIRERNENEKVIQSLKVTTEKF